MVDRSSGKPYTQIEKEDCIIRTFDQSVLNEELVWHRDKKDRYVEVLEGEDWKFQYDNELPFVINVGMKFKVESLVYHRLHKGSTNLILRIMEIL